MRIVACCFVAVVALVGCPPPSPTPPPPSSAEPAHLRFRLENGPDSALDDDDVDTEILAGARPLFGDIDDVRALSVQGAPDLAAWFTVDVSDGDASAAEEALRVLGAVDISREPAFEPALLSSSSPVEAPAPSCPVKTPVYDDRQGYRKALDIDSAWALPGGRGKGVSLADVEGEWNDKHEDLPGARITHVAGRRQKNEGWRAHGTAVLGVVTSLDNGAGMLGLAPDVDHIYTSSLGMIGAARALYEAAKALAPGDVLIVELHGPGPNADGNGQKGFVPMEWWQPEFDAIQWATKKGVIVVEAGGNGGENLDAPVYKRRFDRKLRDSGAILVGAGAPAAWPEAPERARLGFSNYGSRVDVQGWGRKVATLDYGDLQGCSTPARKYTALFSGTSSASPVVAGAAVVVQGVSKARGKTLSPLEMRALLTETGTPQVGTEHIGPMPHVGRGIAALR